MSSFKTCATAADNIVDLIRAYDKAFSVRKAPYLISYATYVAATIHARIAAKRGAGSHAHGNLVACLGIFRENQETNWAVRRANGIVQNLMKRLGLDVPDLNSLEKSNTASQDSADAMPGESLEQEDSLQTPDIDGILESFIREQENAQAMQSAPHAQARTQSTEMPPPSQQYGPFPDSSAYTDDRNAMHVQDQNYGAFQGQYAQPTDGPMTVDDLLYGLNGTALDNFAFLDWDSM